MIITSLFLFICIIHICMQRTSSASAAMFSLNKSVFYSILFYSILERALYSRVYIMMVKCHGDSET